MAKWSILISGEGDDVEQVKTFAAEARLAFQKAGHTIADTRVHVEQLHDIHGAAARAEAEANDQRLIAEAAAKQAAEEQAHSDSVTDDQIRFLLAHSKPTDQWMGHSVIGTCQEALGEVPGNPIGARARIAKLLQKMAAGQAALEQMAAAQARADRAKTELEAKAEANAESVTESSEAS